MTTSDPRVNEVVVLLHADDLGATPTMNTAILNAWKNGWLDGFSILGNAQDIGRISTSLDAPRRARIGVHLNLSEGVPVLPAFATTRLTGPDRRFKHSFTGILFRYLFLSSSGRRELATQIEQEWRAQIEKVKVMIHPRPVTVLDGHRYFHMLPNLFRIAARLAAELSIPEIRIVSEPFHWSSKPTDWLSPRLLVNIAKWLFLSLCSIENRRIAHEYGLRWPEATVGLLYSGILNPANVQSGVSKAKRGGAQAIEIVLHVGNAIPAEVSHDAKSWASFALSPQRKKEYQSLSSLHREFHGSV